MSFWPRHALHAATVLVLLVSLCSGCQALLTAAYLIAPEDTPAEFTGLRGKHVAVVCKPIVELEFSDVGSARELATIVGGLLKQNVRKSRVIDEQEVARWIDENAWVDFPTLGKALDADLVVAIDLEAFHMHEGSTLYRGKATARVRVFDIQKEGRLHQTPRRLCLSCRQCNPHKRPLRGAVSCDVFAGFRRPNCSQLSRLRQSH